MTTITRRRLIQAASAGAALHLCGGAAFARPGSPEASARSLLTGPVRPLSVGYVEDSDLLPRLDARFVRRRADGPRVVPAARLPLGDQSLAQGTVEMRVHGFYPGIPSRRETTFAQVMVIAFFPSFDPIEPGPFPYFCWQGMVRPGPSKSPPVRFLVPLRDDGGLELVVEVYGGRPERTSLYADFTVDWYAGRPKLQRGLYLLGLEPGAWREPRELAPAEGTSLVVSFEGVPEDDPRLVAAAT